MNTRGFGATTARELLARAAHEIADLEHASRTHFDSEDEAKNKVGSRAAACVGTLWNIVDWLEQSEDPATRLALQVAGLAGEKAVRDYVMAASPDLKLCWELTNGYKHSKLKGHSLKESQIEEALLSAPPMFVPQSSVRRFVPKAVISATRERLHVIEVCQRVLTFWQEFFERVGL